MDAHCLQASGVAADMDQLDTGRELGIAVVELDASPVYAAHDVENVVHIVGVAHHVKRHVAPGGILQLLLLQVQARVGQQVNVAGMVVVQMRDDHVPHVVGRDAKPADGVDRTAQVVALAARRGLAEKPVSTRMVRSAFLITQTK